jgi:hypothetical protein
MPSLAGLKWNPIVTILNPTSAMTDEDWFRTQEDTVDKSAFRWLREKLNVDKKTSKTNETSANNHT